jgi:glutamate racemase
MMNTAFSPIGIFDSGVGGLTVARALVRALPQERLLYFADTAHVPYGPRPLAELKQLALDITAFLFQQGAKVVIMASNSSDAAGLEAARLLYGREVFGVINPGARAAVKAGNRGRIGVLATQATVSSQAYRNALHQLDPALQIIEQACPEFVPLVESGQLDTPYTRQMAAEYLKPVLEFGVEVIVLGCTQYPLLTPLIQELAGPAMTLVDPAEEVAKEVADFLKEKAWLNTAPGPAEHRFFASGEATSLREVGAAFFGQKIDAIEPGRLWG